MKRAETVRLKNQLIQLQARLDVESRHLIDRLPEVLHTPGELSDVPTHNADHDSEGLDAEVKTAKVQDQLREQVAAALQRIEFGKYGVCESCGQQIPVERLEALPHTPFCVDCEMRVEREEKIGKS